MPSSTDLPTPNFTYDPDVALKCGHVAAKLDAPMENCDRKPIGERRWLALAGSHPRTARNGEDMRGDSPVSLSFCSCRWCSLVRRSPMPVYLPTLNAVKRPWIFRCQAEMPRSA